MNDPRLKQNLARLRLSFNSVPKVKQKIVLLDNANLSTGGDAVDVTSKLHPSWKKLVVDITRDMGLRFCGVDIMTGGDIAKPCEDYHVIELNASPGLDHYADIGKAQQKKVEELYLKVLQALKKSGHFCDSKKSA